MGNCLVTKLKGNVDNDNLSRLGEFVFKGYTDSAEEQYIYVLNPQPYSIRSNMDMLENSTGVNLGRLVEMPNGGARYIRLKNGQNIYFSNKYAVTTVDVFGEFLCELDISQFNYSNDLETFSIRNNLCDIVGVIDLTDKEFSCSLPFDNVSNIDGFKGNHLSLSYCKLNNVIHISNTIHYLTLYKCTGSINNLVFPSDFTATYVEIQGADGGMMTGNADFLGSIVGIEKLIVSDSHSVTLTIENFVANRRAAGQITGSMSMGYLGSINTYFNGELYPNSWNDHSLSWTANTITLDGTTINA